MLDFLHSINNREIAILFWSLVLVLLALVKGHLGSALVGAAKAFAQPKVVLPILVLSAYVVAVVWCLWRCGLWEFALLKTTLRWYLLTVVVLMSKSLRAVDHPDFFKKIVFENFRLAVVLEFLSDKFVFDLPYEMIFIPVISAAVILLFVAKRNTEDSILVKPLSTVVEGTGLALLAFILSAAWTHFAELRTIESLKEILLPPVLTLSFLPALYVFALWVHCETKFVMIDCWASGDKRAKRWAKQEILRRSIFHFRVLHAVGWPLYSRLDKARSRAEVRRLIGEAVAEEYIMSSESRSTSGADVQEEPAIL